jgi:glycosyltransferase involved in cell wall biosynthesis
MHERIRVLYLAPTGTKYAGDNKSLLNLIEGLKKYDISPLVMTTSNAVSNEFMEIGVRCSKVHPYPSYIFTNYCPQYRNLREILLFPLHVFINLKGIYFANRALKNIVAEFKPHIIHSNTGPTIIGYLVSKIMNIPHVWHIRECIELGFETHLLVTNKRKRKIFHHYNNHLIAISQYVKEYHRLPIESKVIYDGIHKSKNIEFIQNKEKYFLFVGRLNKLKGARILLEAFIEFCKTDNSYELYLAGEADDNVFRQQLRKMIMGTKLENRVRLLGNREDVFELMAHATALVMPSVNEGFGMVTAEAMFNGCLVIGNNTSGTKEILEKENLGILYNGKNELVLAMKNVVSNGIESYFPMIKKAQELASNLYSQEQNAASVYKYYTEILEKRM